MLSDRVRDTLLQHPDWGKLVRQFSNEPPFERDYVPEVVEVFDQQGLICGRAWDIYYQIARPSGHQFDFVAWCFDSQLAVLYVGEEAIINRLPVRDIP